MLRRIVHSPYLNLISGLVLLITSVHEIMVTVDKSSFCVRHGVLIFSIIQIAKVVPQVMDGLSDIHEVGGCEQNE